MVLKIRNVKPFTSFEIDRKPLQGFKEGHQVARITREGNRSIGIILNSKGIFFKKKDAREMERAEQI